MACWKGRGVGQRRGSKWLADPVATKTMEPSLSFCEADGGRIDHHKRVEQEPKSGGQSAGC